MAGVSGAVDNWFVGVVMVAIVGSLLVDLEPTTSGSPEMSGSSEVRLSGDLAGWDPEAGVGGVGVPPGCRMGAGMLISVVALEMRVHFRTDLND